jgi:hemolysin III
VGALGWVVPASVALIVMAGSGSARAAVAVYSATLAAAFAVSATYHRLGGAPAGRLRMQRLDHATIYLLIAGTYTPVCVLALPPKWGIPLLAVVWTGALAGFTLKLATSNGRFKRPLGALYVVLGWTALVALPVIVTNVSLAALALMIAGGASYTLGAIIFFRRRPDPWPRVFGYHEIWHACTVAAGASHFAMIWLVAT